MVFGPQNHCLYPIILVNNTMDIIEDDEQLGETSEQDSELSDGELQDAFAKGLLKPGLNFTTQEPKKIVNNVEGLKQCLADFRKNTLPWIERLDMVNLPADDIIAKSEGRLDNKASEDINPDDDFQREMFFYRQAQEAVLEAMPRLLKLKIATKRPEDYFAEMAKSDQQMQKIRKKLITKQIMMEKSEKAKKLREQRKYGKKVQVEVIQKRQREKKAMMSSVKRYQKGMTDKLDFLEGDQKTAKGGAPAKGGAGKGAGGQTPDKKAMNKKGPNAKRKYKDQRFGFGGKKSGTKWNTKDSHNDVSGFRAKVAHGKGGKGGKGGKAGPGGRGPTKGGAKRPGKNARKKMKGRS
ncbi:probable rRNA-processing protein EBP2 [Oncorhynchus clarkii lewisi]|uniref:probable rRNA-processing protein EBP2 n=1 Tax=Oncorhynchus clarkii lewisi TaxID=490388 RepID=UPI0039B8EE6E